MGEVVIGGDHPVVIQSMTTAATTDTAETIRQIETLEKVGCQIVRLTTPAMADVENLPTIRTEMKKRGLVVPLAADVHFLPEIALRACDYVEKVRVNPGNFADRKRFQTRDYTDAEYREELDRIHAAFVPIVRRAKENGVALRIGTNHGSLSDRIMNRFGDTPLGMVESALEFVRIAQAESFHEIVLSMKASNPIVMVAAYRLLVSRMNEEKMDYPLHLGVTEAGEGEDGRVKSAIGIGSLLSDGLGDTIRVSLTEDSEHEIPVAEKIVALCVPEASTESKSLEPTWDPFSYGRRESRPLESRTHSTGGKEVVRVRTRTLSSDVDPKPDAIVVENSTEEIHSTYGRIARNLPPGEFDELSLQPSPAWKEENYSDKLVSLLEGRPLWLRIRKPKEIEGAIALLKTWPDSTQVGIEVEGRQLVSLGRQVAVTLSKEGLSPPMHLHLMGHADDSEEDLLLRASVQLGGLLCDGIGDSVEISSAHGSEFNTRVAFNVLQATRLRMSKVDLIACPSCGRTLFDLQATTARIREKTEHLKGVKIAIMGCIVNGPGEMADADFGYVGSGPGHINLYVGKECVARKIPEAEADQRLIELIQSQGRWVDPPSR